MKFLIRLDDCHKNQHYENWDKILSILYKYNIKPLIAIIPNNNDTSIEFCENTEDDFLTWLIQNKENIDFGVHGFNHSFHKSSKSMYKSRSTSEFNDLSYVEQRMILQNSLDWFRSNDFYPNWFVAPRHSFDKITVDICKFFGLSISDGTEINIFKYKDVLFVPQLYNKARIPLFSGVYTFCYHPNSMSDSDFIELESFLVNYYQMFIEWEEVKIMKVKGCYLRSQVINNIWIIQNYVRNTFFKKYRS
ncbi:DUF2334 domain-containing protein [Flavobacterium sp.]|uniref:DUF2334 domain-containing protein n=1 Tax=Flavobacterium sp. TaxID=239 RepID=UPI004047A485